MNIAILGSAPSSVGYAPFDDDENWEIWACSPANMKIPRCNVWYEIHSENYLLNEKQRAYCEWVRKQKDVVTIHDWPGFETRKLPVDHYLQKYGEEQFTSSIAWMLADAIDAIERKFGDEKKPMIGVWGVDMAANTEWEHQRPGCRNLMWEARKRGIDVKVPKQCDLAAPARIYGLFHDTNFYHKQRARKAELEQRKAAVDQLIEQKTREKYFLEGGLEDIDYQTKIWGGGK